MRISDWSSDVCSSDLNGTLVHNMPGYSAPRVLSFEAHDLPIDLPQIEAFRGRGGRDRELTIPELVRTGGDIREPEEFRRASIATFNHRMVQVAAMFALPLLALSLAIPPKRSTSADRKSTRLNSSH